MTIGTYENTAGSTGGDVVTGNVYTEYFSLTPHAAAILVTEEVVNETFDDAKLPGTITVVTAADSDGRWMAIGV